MDGMLRAVLLLLLAGPAALLADDAAVDYVQDVRPILHSRCARCHGALKQEAGLRLDAGLLIVKGGENGPVVTAKNPAKSPLLDRVVAKDDTKMPPEGDRLSAAQVDTLRRWIAEGARFPANENVPVDPAKHWSFQRPQLAVAPKLPLNDRAANPIDAFLYARLATAGIQPVRPAQRAVLLRRVYFDLIGLPPTPAEMQDFLTDSSPDAYPHVVDRLLASPQHAERWGRHWMDVWRYSDWYGYGSEVRNSALHIWRWRDWIIESLATDKPYREMIVEMLAADEAAPADTEKLRATGYLARNYYKFNRNVWLDNTVEHTSKAFLAITMNCCRCHDHVYDPLPQTAYYEFRAIFEPYQVRTDRVPGGADAARDGISRAYDADLTKATYLFVRGNEAAPETSKAFSPTVPISLGGSKWNLRGIALPAEAYAPEATTPFVREELARLEANLKTAEQSVASQAAEVDKVHATLAVVKHREAKTALAAYRARLAAHEAKVAGRADARQLATAAAAAERSANIARAEAIVSTLDTELQAAPTAKQGAKAVVNKKSKAVIAKLAQAKKTLEELNKQSPATEPTTLGPIYPAISSGRRLALAHWIADDANPLTARVAVNHIWLRHFGKPLVPTVFDFGLNGRAPTHPELLDWLAVDFMRGGWSMRRLHRLIVLSEAYQRDSIAEGDFAKNERIDPDNLLLWRMNPHRLEAESVRDAVLAVSRRLDRKIGGPELDAKLGETTYRRSIYYRHAPEKFMTFLQTFDSANTNECYMRAETVVPQQALALTNSALSIDQARRLAADLGGHPESSADATFVQALFQRTIGRLPSDQEQRECMNFLASQTRLLADRSKLTAFTVGGATAVSGATDPQVRAREGLAHVLLNHNEFLAIR